MGETQRPAFVGYGDAVTGLPEVGEPVGAGEDAVEASAGPSEDAKPASWQRMRSMRNPGEQLPGVRRHPAALA
jgi:hypothetical protein